MTDHSASDTGSDAKGLLAGSPEAPPSSAQMRYLKLGIGQPGGKLPLFDGEGQAINPKTIRACIEKGWAEPWFNNPIKPQWLVCKLTDAGKHAAKG